MGDMVPRQLHRVVMSVDHDISVFFTNVYQPRYESVYVGEALSDELIYDIVIEGLTNAHDQTKYNTEPDPILTP